VLIVVDQMRGDYVDKFQGQWSGGLKRLVREGAWFRNAAYPYAATETCVGHATISTGAFPAEHGIVANTWWDRDSQKMVTCTSDPKAKNEDYGASAKGGDSAWRLAVPAFADELRFQQGLVARVVTFSLKARAAIMLAGHQADAATWQDSSPWQDSGMGLWQPRRATVRFPSLRNTRKHIRLPRITEKPGRLRCRRARISTRRSLRAQGRRRAGD